MNCRNTVVLESCVQRVPHVLRFLTVVVGLLAVLATAVPALAGTEDYELTSSDPTQGDAFGYAVSISGSTAVVGAYHEDLPSAVNAGAAYVFTGGWTETPLRLTADVPAASDFFGCSVSIDGDTAIVGSYGADHSGKSTAGAAYVFTAGWTEAPTQLTADDAADNDQFGYSVSISGDTALVGAQAVGSNTGAAYVFTRSGDEWTQQAKLTATGGVAGDWFGVAASISGDTVVVGAYGVDSNTGAAYVFTRSEETWTQQQKLTATDGAAGDFFGASVSVDGDTAIVGAYLADPDEKSSAGAAYVFTRSGETWTQQQKLKASDATATDMFGRSVSVCANTAVVGAWLADLPGAVNAGAAYVFTRSGTTWTEEEILTASGAAENDYFGISSSISGDTAVVGAYGAAVGTSPEIDDAGAAFVFEGLPTLVELVAFSAVWNAEAVLVQWETTTEIDTVGFDVWRSEERDGEYTRITDSIIPAWGGPVSGAGYSLEDTGVSPGTEYWYELEDIESDGSSTFHGPVRAEVDPEGWSVPEAQASSLGARSGADSAALGAVAMVLLPAGVAGLCLRRARRRRREEAEACAFHRF